LLPLSTAAGCVKDFGHSAASNVRERQQAARTPDASRGSEDLIIFEIHLLGQKGVDAALDFVEAVQRPARSPSPLLVRRVQGSQPMEP